MTIADDLQNAHERDLQLGILVDEHGIRLVGGDVFEDISRLTFEHLAQHVERAETDGSDFACLDAREIDVVIPTLSASSFSEICRSAMISSR